MSETDYSRLNSRYELNRVALNETFTDPVKDNMHNTIMDLVVNGC